MVHEHGMSLTDQARERLSPPARQANRDITFRVAPHNIEAEQALLGAILINNDAFDRVSDFLRAEHFSEEIHRRIYDVASQLIRAGKVATPVTLKTFLGDADLGGVTIPQYLARLAAEATAIINTADYGRTVHDLATRRDLILIGEDIVNGAYDAPVDISPREQIEDAERKLYSIAESGRYDGGFQPFSEALTHAVDRAAAAFERDGGLSGISTGMHDLDRIMGGLQASDLVIVAGRPGMGKTALATNIAFTIAKAYEGRPRRRRALRRVNGGVVGFFSLEMSSEQLATRILAEQSRVAVRQDPPRRRRRAGVPQHRRGEPPPLQALPLLYRRYRRASRSLSSDPRAPAEASARPRHARGRLPASCCPARTRAGDNRVQELTEITTRPEGTRQGAERAGGGPVAAVRAGRVARRQAPAALRPSRIRLDRAGCRRGACSSTAKNITSRTSSPVKARRSS